MVADLNYEECNKEVMSDEIDIHNDNTKIRNCYISSSGTFVKRAEMKFA